MIHEPPSPPPVATIHRNLHAAIPPHRLAHSTCPTPNNTSLQAGADVNEATNDHRTPLHWAAYWGQVEAAVVLLDAGGSP